MPHVITIAGPNGAGKSTSAPAILRDFLQVDEFVNADVIAQGLSAFQPEKAAIQAGRIMLNRIHELAKEKKNFAFETTLASRSFAPWISHLKQEGYEFHLIFLCLKKVELAIQRVKERVKAGGHFVPEETVRRRYISGIKNFFNLYRPLADSWKIYNNSSLDAFSLIASQNNNENLIIKNKLIWSQILEIRDAK